MRIAGSKTRGVVCPIFIVLFFAIAAFWLSACAAAPQALPSITNVFSVKTVAEYDGLPHGIVVRNTLESDSVYYSLDGVEWQSQAITFVEQGDYKVYYKVVRNGFADFVDFGELSITRTLLDGVSAAYVTVIYDGQPHGIRVDGALPSDTVVYSPHNAFTEVGEYSVGFSVERRGVGYYGGECRLTILPDILGAYYNAERGALEITETTAFDIDGCGELNGKPFRVENGVLTYDGHEYKQPRDGEKAYAFDINGTKLYHIGGAVARFAFAFNPTVVTIDGARFGVSGEYNFVESVVSLGEISNDGAEYAVAAADAVTDVKIVLSERARRPLPDTEEIIVYDGAAHAVTAHYDGDAVFTLNGVEASGVPSVTDIGEYVYEITVYSAVYLPEKTTHKATVVLRGAYFSDDKIIEFDGLDAIIDGTRKVADYASKTADGKPFAVADGCVVYDGERMREFDGGLLLGITVNGVYGVLALDQTQIDEIYVYVTCDGETARVRMETWRGQFYSRSFALAEIARADITVNGVAPFYDESDDRYVITPSELGGAVAFIDLKIT